MKPDKIAELQKLAAEMAARRTDADRFAGDVDAGVHRYGVFIDDDVLSQLLDEREALLEALKKWGRHEGSTPIDEPDCLAEYVGHENDCVCGLGAVIAKAES